VKFGRNRPPADAPKKIALSWFQIATSPAAPATCDYSPAALPALTNPYMNKQLSCCIVSGYYHCLGVWSANATGVPFVATDDQIVKDYSAISGYQPGNDFSDTGCNESDAISYFERVPAADGSTLAAALSVDARKADEVRSCVYDFEHVYLCLELPDGYVQPFPSVNGYVWSTGTPNPQQGHCIMACGYNADGLIVCSWGLMGILTWAALAELATAQNGGTCYALLNQDIVDRAQGKSPLGLDWTALTNAFDGLNGTSIVPPGP
jgi:hypothetical protein